jgi:ABC-type branched-subunit amino acid transport system substrate-binding protein
VRLPLFVGVLLVAGCNRSDAPKPIELGHLSPPNHDDAEFQALDLAVADLNQDATRLPLGRSVRVIHAPGGTRPEEWGAQATRLVALNKVQGLIGGERQEQAERIGMALRDDGVIAISPADGPGAAGQNLFTIGVTPVDRGRVLAKVVLERKPRTVAIVRDPASKSANLAADRFVADCQAAGVRVIDPAPARPAADAIFFACAVTRAVETPTEALRVFGGDEAELPALLAAGVRADGFLVATAFHAELKNERVSAFAKRYREKHGRPPSAAAVLAHDGFTIWLEAVRRANALEAGPVREALAKSDPPFDTLTGPLTFAADHSARRPVFVGRVAEGALTEVKAFEAAR